MKRLTEFVAGLLLAAALAASAHAQSTLLQSGTYTAGRVPMYVGTGTQVVVQDSGPASGGGVGLGLRELLITARGTGTAPFVEQGTGPLGTTFCQYDAPTTNAAGYHYLCMSPNAQGGGLIAYGSGGVASQLPLQFLVNGSNINANAGTFGSPTEIPVFSVDVNGMITGITQVEAASPLVIGTTPISGGTEAFCLTVDAGGVLGNAACSAGSGSVTTVSVVTANGVSGNVANPTTTPAITLTLGAITPTTVNGLTVTTTNGTLTLVNGSSLITSGANPITLTSTGSTNVTLPTSGTLATTAGTLPISGGTLTGGLGFSTTNTNDIGTNATTLAPRTVYAGTSFVGPVGTFTTSIAIGGGSSLTTSNQTGTGSIVLATSPTLVTPTLGVATATSINGQAITAGSGTLTLGSATLNAGAGGTLAAMAFTTDAASLTGTLACARMPALTTDVTTSAGSCATTIAANAVTYAKFQQVAAVSLVGNATGGAANATGITLGATLVFSGSALQTAAITGDVTASANAFATTVVKLQGRAVESAAPSDGQVLTWVAGSSEWQAIAAPSGNVPVGGTTGQALVKASGTDFDTEWADVTGLGTVTSVAMTVPSVLSVAGSPITGSGTLAVSLATQTAATVFAGPTSGGAATPTFRALIGTDLPNPAASTKGGVQSKAAEANKFLTEISTAGAVSNAQPAASDLSNGTTGSGNVVLSTSPVIVTPTLGVATVTSVNKVAITAPATSATLTIADGKTLGVSNTLTFTGTDASSVAFGTGGTVAYTNVTTLSSLVSIGTITTGTWNGTTIAVANGGTGTTTLGGFLLAGTTNTITVGYTNTPFGIGTIASGTVNLACANANYQFYTNNGAHTLAAQSSDCGIDILVTNGASAGAISFSGFTVGAATGSTLTTTNGNRFLISTRRINAIATYSIYALQ